MARNLRAEINLAAIRHNYQLAKSQAKMAKAVAIIKADAYGHGAVQVAKNLSGIADAFGVAAIEEALELREAGIKEPILLLEGFFETEELKLIIQHRLWSAIHSLEQIDRLEAFLDSHPAEGLCLWLKVDSGMHRLGVNPADFNQAWSRLKARREVAELVVMSHFACADEPERPDTYKQIETMSRCLEGIDAKVSLSNSAGVMHWPQAHHDWLRPGIMLYGASPFADGHALEASQQPAMTLTTQVIAIRDVPAGDAVGYGASFVCDVPMRIGTLAVGYADGYSRHAPAGTPVVVNGQRTRIVGRVSMDMITIDLTNRADVQVGDLVELWGEQLSINEVAKYCSTIPYTLLSGLTRRVKRIYKDQ